MNLKNKKDELPMNKINIVSPLSSLNEIKELIKKGASEVYFGVLEKEWSDTYNTSISINRREFKPSNLTDINQVNTIANICSKNNIKSSLTLNSHYYNNHQLKNIMGLLEKIQVDNIIIADISLMKIINRRFPQFNIHVSTGGTSFNSETVKLYKKNGAKRIIFPRHVLIPEVLEIHKEIKDMEYEVFILNQGCINIDGYCYYMHGLEKPKEKGILGNATKKLFSKLPLNIKNKIRLNTIIGNGSTCLQTYRIKCGNKSRIGTYNPNVYCGIKCGVCSLYDLKDIPNLNIKIVGREHSSDKKILDVDYINTILKHLEISKNRTEYIEFCKNHHFKMYNEKCNPTKCYYIND